MQNQEIRLGRLQECTFEQAVQLKNRGFEGYYSTVTTTLDPLLKSFADYGIRPALSVVAFAAGEPVGFVFVALKTVQGKKLAWNGGTGVYPEFRGKGVAKAMMTEAAQVLLDEAVDRAILEVVTKNAHAISAYEHAGFRIADRLVGMSGDVSAGSPPFADAAELPPGWRVEYGKPSDAATLPFYRELAAWECQWHNLPDGMSLVIRDSSDRPVAYSLFQRETVPESTDSGGSGTNRIGLYQCETAPAAADKGLLFRVMLQEVFGNIAGRCRREAVNLSTASPELVPLLQEMGFATDYEQYLMVMENYPNRQA